MSSDKARELTFTYTNWRGETSVRRVMPVGIRFGVTHWHDEPQWLLSANDLDKGETREFAVKDMVFNAALSQPETAVEAVEALEKIADRPIGQSPDAFVTRQIARKALASLRERPTDGGWLPIESAPKEGRFMAYRPSTNAPCWVFRYAPDSDDVVEPQSGKIWCAQWWWPDFPAPPRTGEVG